MPKVTIDGQAAEFDQDLTILQAAESLGIEVPHYCYHPGLSIAGNCRMCLVEVEKVPKLQIGCNTRITEGMVVHTRNDRVKKAQEAVLEFLLINHPIDCPICDQAGECKLQDYYMDFDRRKSRMAVEEKVRKRKVVDIGPRVILDQERCILCTRCVRFLDEITQTSELGVFHRGDNAAIDLAPGARLENDYSENVVDICPVGALTSRDFRFQARVWYLDRTATVCGTCARGCNVDAFHRQGQVYRFRPRYNPEVNGYWMCDLGRESAEGLQGEHRLLVPELRDGNAMRSGDWEEGIARIASSIATTRESHGDDAVAVIVGAHATNEEAFLLRVLARQLGVRRLVGHAWSPPDARDDGLLIRADRNPNRRGLEALGIPTDDDALLQLLEQIEAGEVQALLVFRTDLAGTLGRERVEAALEKIGFLAVLGDNRNETSLYADLLLPVGTYVESEGTFTNFEGRVQRLRQAFPPPGQAREGWQALARLLEAVGGQPAGADPARIFAAIGEGFAGLDYEQLGLHGLPSAASGRTP